MNLKIILPKDLKRLDETIEALRELIKTDTREIDRIIHKQALNDLTKYIKSLNIKKIDCFAEQSKHYAIILKKYSNKLYHSAPIVCKRGKKSGNYKS